MTAPIFIDGEAGTTGLGMRDRLAGRAGIEIRSLGDARKDVSAARALLAEVDLVLFCLADEAARFFVSTVIGAGQGRRAG